MLGEKPNANLQSKNGINATSILGGLTVLSVVVGIIFIFVFQSGFKPAVEGVSNSRPFGTLIAISFATASLLGTIGFIFGITRTHTIERVKSEDGDDQNYYRYIPNPNLEEVSDWLTKIIIGVGLVQLTTLSEKIWVFSQKVSTSINGDEKLASFIVAVIVYHASIGLVLGYLWTRLKYGPAIKSSDDKLTPNEKRLDYVESGVDMLLQNLEADKVVDAVLKFEISDIDEVEINDAIAKAQTHVQNRAYWNAKSALRKAGGLVREEEERTQLGKAAALIFGALIKADKEGKHKHNYFDKALAHLYSGEENASKKFLKKAIHYRDTGFIESPYGLMEIVMAILQIQSQESDDSNEILKTIKTGLEDSWVMHRWNKAKHSGERLHYCRATILDWIDSNDLKYGDIGLTDEGNTLRNSE